MAKKGTLRVRIVGDASHLNRTLGKAGSTLKKFGTKALLGVGVAAAAGVAASVKAFADFDQAMTRSTAIMGDVSDAMRKDMSTAARDVAKTTEFSAEQAAESYFFLASAGMDAATSIEALPKVAKFAQAGQFDMAQATDLATDAQSALGLTAEDTAENIENLGRVQDVFVKANTLANASVEQFATSMTQKAGGALRSLGKDIEEGTAVLAVFADQGIKGERAGTILRSTLDGLTESARKNADAFEKAGVKVFDADGNMRNMADIAADLEDRLGDMTTEAQEAELAALGFNQRTREGILALIGNSDALREYESDLRTAAGTTEEVAGKQMETFNAKMGLIWDKIKDVGISVGESLMPAFEAFADWLDANLGDITGWFDSVATKFTDLLDAAEAGTGGVEHELGALDIRSKEISRKYIGTLGEMEGETIHAMAQAGISVEDFQKKSGSEFETAGGFMTKLWEAWKVIWNEDIDPWLMNTVVPWIEKEFAPAVGRALLNAGKTAGKKFGEGLGSTLMDGFRRQFSLEPLRQFEDAMDDIPGIGAIDDRLQNAPIGRTPIGGIRGAFDDGGIVPGRRGTPQLIKAHGGETVLPTHKDRSAGQGPTIHIENLTVGSTRDLGRTRHELHKAAIEATYG